MRAADDIRREVEEVEMDLGYGDTGADPAELRARLAKLRRDLRAAEDRAILAASNA